MQNQSIFNFEGCLGRYLRGTQTRAARAWAVILIVQDLPVALVDIKPNHPLEGRQQMLREWRDYSLKTQWQPSALSLCSPGVTVGDQEEQTAFSRNIIHSWHSKFLALCGPDL